MRTISFRAVLADVAALACAMAVFVASALEPPGETAAPPPPVTTVAR